MSVWRLFGSLSADKKKCRKELRGMSYTKALVKIYNKYYREHVYTDGHVIIIFSYEVK